MSQIEIKNAIIEDTILGYQDSGILTFQLQLSYGNSCQHFGGYALDRPIKDADGTFIRRQGVGWGMELIAEVLNVVGVEKWEDLKGKQIRVKVEHVKVHAIGNVLKDKWLNPSELGIKEGLDD